MASLSPVRRTWKEQVATTTLAVSRISDVHAQMDCGNALAPRTGRLRRTRWWRRSRPPTLRSSRPPMSFSLSLSLSLLGTRQNRPNRHTSRSLPQRPRRKIVPSSNASSISIETGDMDGLKELTMSGLPRTQNTRSYTQNDTAYATVTRGKICLTLRSQVGDRRLLAWRCLCSMRRAARMWRTAVPHESNRVPAEAQI